MARDRQFEKGEVGVDGEPIDSPDEPSDRDAAAAIEGLHRNRAYLGREFLTWILWASNDGRALCVVEGADVTVLVTGRVVLRGLAGEATELAVKGHLSAYSAVVRFALDQGLLVHSARLRIEWHEQVYEFTLDAEYLDVRAAVVPKGEAGSSEDDADDGPEALHRLESAERVGALIDGLWQAFMEIRLHSNWGRRTVPAMKKWMQDL